MRETIGDGMENMLELMEKKEGMQWTKTEEKEITREVKGKGRNNTQETLDTYISKRWGACRRMAATGQGNVREGGEEGPGGKECGRGGK